ncbi:MAG: hypothetical protein MUP16_05075 [Sedimentisphaerales bacterium]|nr:hypothetical protein [Sedimentisphaerales bacterium]
MIEQIKRINNPLTVIAIFSGLAEVAATVSLGLVESKHQYIFIWFVMLFPILLLILFFLTLNLNPKVLYAPTDYRDERNFLFTLSGLKDPSLITPIEVHRENFNEATKILNDPKHYQFWPSELTGYKTKVLGAANKFFAILTKKAKMYIKTGVLSSIQYGIQADNFFLLQYSIDKDLLLDNTIGRTVYDFHVIVYIIYDAIYGIRMEAIGHNIICDNPELFANQVYKQIEMTIRRQCYQDKVNKLLESSYDSEQGQ